MKKVKALKNQLEKIIENKAVGQINPAPIIEVLFSTLARTTIQRGERGFLYVVSEDSTVDTKWSTYSSVADIKEEEYTPANYQMLVSAFALFAPNKVVVRRRLMSEDETPVLEPIGDVLAELAKKKITHLAIPEIKSADDATVVAWVKENITKKGVVYVSPFATTDADSCAVVQLGNTVVKHELIEGYTLGMFSVMIAGAIAGCPLNRSLDNIRLPYITYANDVAEYDLGKFYIYENDGDYRVVMAVNSLVSFDSTWKEDTRYIKIFEGINIVRFDIQDTFKDYWCGLYLNTFENKKAFCETVNEVYFKSLAPEVLSPDYLNRIDIDVEANRQYIITQGDDPDLMSEMEIKMYPTGAYVYLTGQCRFSNTMINLALEISY